MRNLIKKNGIILMLIFVALMISVISCKKEEDDKQDNYLSINGKSYPFSNCYLIDRDNGGGFEYEIIFTEGFTLSSLESGIPDNGIISYFNIPISTDPTTDGLEDGEYTYDSETALPFTWFDAYIMLNNNIAESRSDYSGEPSRDSPITISKSGNNYTFTIDGKDEMDEPLIFRYSGKVTILN